MNKISIIIKNTIFDFSKQYHILQKTHTFELLNPRNLYGVT